MKTAAFFALLALYAMDLFLWRIGELLYAALRWEGAIK